MGWEIEVFLLRRPESREIKEEEFCANFVNEPEPDKHSKKDEERNIEHHKQQEEQNIIRNIKTGKKQILIFLCVMNPNSRIDSKYNIR